MREGTKGRQRKCINDDATRYYMATHTIAFKRILQLREDKQPLRSLLIRHRVRAQLGHKPFQLGEHFADTRGGRSRGHQLEATGCSQHDNDSRATDSPHPTHPGGRLSSLARRPWSQCKAEIHGGRGLLRLARHTMLQRRGCGGSRWYR